MTDETFFWHQFVILADLCDLKDSSSVTNDLMIAILIGRKLVHILQRRHATSLGHYFPPVALDASCPLSCLKIRVFL